VSRYQKGKINLDFTEARDNEWQWHQLGHMQVCTSLQTDNHATRKVKSIWILLKQETMSGSGISWAICKSAPRSRQITMQHSTTQFFTGRMPFLPPDQQRQSTEGEHAVNLAQ